MDNQQLSPSLSLPEERGNSLPLAKRRGPLFYWYQWTSPPEPDIHASLQERELFRRGRTGSQITIFLFLLIFVSYPAAFAGSNSLLIFILTVNLAFLAFAMVLNRLRLVTIAGIIVVLGVVASPTANILTTPGGINTAVLPIFGFLVLPLVCSVSFLPPAWVFVTAAANSLFTVLVLRLWPNVGELHHVLEIGFPGILIPILLSQWIVATVAFLWVRGAKLAIQRADRAEEIILLQQEMDRYTMERSRQRKQLEESIHLIELVHTQIANGDLSARVPLSKVNVLWSISGQLNNLLARYQQTLAEVNQLRHQRMTTEQMVLENAQLRNELRRLIRDQVQ